VEDFEVRKRKDSDEAWLLSYADLITNLLLFFVALFAAMEVSEVKLQQVQEALAGKVSKHSLREMESELQAYIEDKNYEDVITANLTDRGVIIGINSGIVFPLGSAEIDAKYRNILMDVLTTVLPYAQKYKFAVEGHTDSIPVKANSRYKSNWELGSARALNVRDHVEAVGIPRTKLHIEAFADTQPLMTDGTKTRESDNRQRRVMIRIY